MIKVITRAWRKVVGRPIDEIVNEAIGPESGPYGPRPPYVPRHAKYVQLKIKKENGS